MDDEPPEDALTGPATCSAPECGAAIIFARTASGAETPFDADPTPEGTWLLAKSKLDGVIRATFGGRPGIGAARSPARQAAEATGRNFYRSHFATCPAAKTFRRADHVPEQEVESSDASSSSCSSEPQL